jgi:hypothetical protein
MRLTPRVAGFRSEHPAGFKLECMAGFVGTRTKLTVEAAEGALTRLRWVTAAIAGPERIAIR